MKKVGLLLTIFSTHTHEAMRGIATYAGRYGAWQIYTRPQTTFGFLPDLEHADLDGLIAYQQPHTDVEPLLRRGVPVVNMSTRVVPLPQVSVVSDSQALGRLGAAHLLERGFRKLAFCGFENEPFSRDRLLGFQAGVREAGLELAVWLDPGGPSAAPWPAERLAALDRWLRSLPAPVGVMACNDTWGQQVLAACSRAGLTVPEQVAVLGIDNDDVICNLTNPPLSSIDRNVYQLGYEAAALLDRLMAGEAPPTTPMLLPPRRVVARRSTDVLAIEDEQVREAVAFIRANYASPIAVKHVCDAVTSARSSLLRRFQHQLGTSPARLINQHRINQARELLVETDADMPSIATACGFANANHFSTVFRRLAGMPPTQYRKESRGQNVQS
ncbi:substrate-binding domain-containing protein [Phycisphaerales bacterium AB-hyl4]|uniref:Substrate-binding domain-containing protein n=1 Tax=Natronomicrosphaera hydrolytica TaxID=3242702 RepID=A0ABV4U5H3_9BACT